MTSLPESYFTLSVAERLRIMADAPPGGGDVDWLGPNVWFEALRATCKEAAEQLALVEQAFEATKRTEKAIEQLSRLIEGARGCPLGNVHCPRNTPS